MTLKANELRIGNFYDHNGFVNEATPNTIEEVWIAERSWVKPIPLTEEWLLKFGFECVFTNDDHHYYLESIDLSLDRSYQPFGIGKYKLKFEYVHQLQNLYFALTGEELILKNNSNN